MKLKKPVVDYRKLRLKNLNSEEFRHLKLLLYWPLFGILFLIAERFYQTEYCPVHCFLDDMIPFCEWFLIPYLFWFVFIVGMHLYTLFYDVDSFKRMMKYIIFTYSVTIVIYFIFPTCQELRPVEFKRDNILIDFIQAFYQFDTNTNVCPSMHVIGSLSVLEAALWTDTIKSKKVKAGFIIVAVLICISTVFMKQHSILDVLAALPVCLVGHLLFFRKKR